MTFVAVTDAGPIIYLAEIEGLSLLALTDELLIPEAVYSELEEGGVPDELENLDYSVVEVPEAEIDASDLDPGEVAATAVTREREGVLLTDDLAAREWAIEHGIEVHGSVGIIALAFGRGRIDRDEAATLMRELQHETRLFVTGAVIERGIDMLDEREE